MLSMNIRAPLMSKLSGGITHCACVQASTLKVLSGLQGMYLQGGDYCVAYFANL